MDSQAAHLTQPAAFNKETAGSSAPDAKAHAAKPKQAGSKADEPLLPYPDVARTAPAPGNWTQAAAAGALNGSKAGAGPAVTSPATPVAAPAAPASTTGAGHGKGKAGKAGAASADTATWGASQPGNDWDGSEAAKPSAVGEGPVHACMPAQHVWALLPAVS